LLEPILVQRKSPVADKEPDSMLFPPPPPSPLAPLLVFLYLVCVHGSIYDPDFSFALVHDSGFAICSVFALLSLYCLTAVLYLYFFFSLYLYFLSAILIQYLNELRKSFKCHYLYLRPVFRLPYNSLRRSLEMGFKCMKLQNPLLVHSLKSLYESIRIR